MGLDINKALKHSETKSLSEINKEQTDISERLNAAREQVAPSSIFKEEPSAPYPAPASTNDVSSKFKDIFSNKNEPKTEFKFEFGLN